MLPLDLLPLCRPVAGRLWVCRVEQPRQRGRIVLPDGAENYRRVTRSSEAIVVASTRTRFHVGQRVLLADIVGREIHFGFRGELRLLEITPFQVLALIREEPDLPLALQADVSRGTDGEASEAGLQEASFEEGSAEGLR